MRLRHVLINVWIFRGIVFVFLQVSLPYSRTDFTLELKMRSLVFVLIFLEAQMFLSMTKAALAIWVLGCIYVCVCVWRGRGPIRGIVQYVIFSIDVSFFAWKINRVNYKKHSGRWLQTTLTESWTGTQEEKSKFVDATRHHARLSLWIFYADRSVYIFDLHWSDWYVLSTMGYDAVNKNTFLRWTAFNNPTVGLCCEKLLCVKPLLRWLTCNIPTMGFCCETLHLILRWNFYCEQPLTSPQWIFAAKLCT